MKRNQKLNFELYVQDMAEEELCKTTEDFKRLAQQSIEIELRLRLRVCVWIWTLVTTILPIKGEPITDLMDRQVIPEQVSVPIIHCQDCRFGTGHAHNVRCDLFYGMGGYNDFCSRGEWKK